MPASSLKQSPASRLRYPVVVFDLDGTLLRGTTALSLLASVRGRGHQADELDRAFQAHEMSNAVAADLCAAWFRGMKLSEVAQVLDQAPWIDDVQTTLRTLVDAGANVLLGTLSWRFVGDLVASRFGLAAASGTEMPIVHDVLSGVVSRHFDEYDKLAFVEEWCAARGYAMREVVAIGDSRSDVPLFIGAGMSIALNATPEARAHATHAVDAESLTGVLSLLMSA